MHALGLVLGILGRRLGLLEAGLHQQICCRRRGLALLLGRALSNGLDEACRARQRDRLGLVRAGARKGVRGLGQNGRGLEHRLRRSRRLLRVVVIVCRAGPLGRSIAHRLALPGRGRPHGGDARVAGIVVVVRVRGGRVRRRDPRPGRGKGGRFRAQRGGIQARAWLAARGRGRGIRGGLGGVARGALDQLLDHVHLLGERGEVGLDGELDGKVDGIFKRQHRRKVQCATRTLFLDGLADAADDRRVELLLVRQALLLVFKHVEAVEVLEAELGEEVRLLKRLCVGHAGQRHGQRRDHRLGARQADARELLALAQHADNLHVDDRSHPVVLLRLVLLLRQHHLRDRHPPAAAAHVEHADDFVRIHGRGHADVGEAEPRQLRPGADGQGALGDHLAVIDVDDQVLQALVLRRRAGMRVHDDQVLVHRADADHVALQREDHAHCACDRVYTHVALGRDDGNEGGANRERLDLLALREIHVPRLIGCARVVRAAEEHAGIRVVRIAARWGGQGQRVIAEGAHGVAVVVDDLDRALFLGIVELDVDDRVELLGSACDHPDVVPHQIAAIAVKRRRGRLECRLGRVWGLGGPALLDLTIVAVIRGSILGAVTLAGRLASRGSIELVVGQRCRLLAALAQAARDVVVVIEERGQLHAGLLGRLQGGDWSVGWGHERRRRGNRFAPHGKLARGVGPGELVVARMPCERADRQALGVAIPVEAEAPLQVPDVDVAVDADGSEVLAVRGPSADDHISRVAVGVERKGLGPRVALVDGDALAAGDRNVLAVRVPRDLVCGRARDVVVAREARERLDACVVLEAPEPHRAVGAGRGQIFALGVEGETAHAALVPTQSLDGAIDHRDELDVKVVRCGGNSRAGRIEGNGANSKGEACEAADALVLVLLLEVEGENLVVLTRAHKAVKLHSNAGDRRGMAIDGRGLLIIIAGKDADAFVCTAGDDARSCGVVADLHVALGVHEARRGVLVHVEPPG
eukprot:m.40582 g.40582  ORF g.40582 m.40582 type:complete len:983 (-) comp5621_c0_seq1:15-2963(-)